ncbi:MAG: hypothetical protein AAFZ18_39290, partial [Myxococcota bacterium]
GASAGAAPVLIFALGNAGELIGQFGGTLTDSTGGFSVTVDDGVVASSRLVASALVDDVVLQGTVTATSGLTVDPASTGVLAATLLLTETRGGRSLSDFTAVELADVTGRARTALTMAGTNLDDPAAVRAEVIRSVGGLLADYSGGTFAFQAVTLPVPMDMTTPIASFEFDLITGGGATYDIQGDGEVDDGSSGGNQGDACDDCFELNVGGETFPSSSSAVLEDGNEVRIGPATIAGLQVTRRIWGDPVGDFIRYTESFTNTSTSVVNVDVRIDHNLGADSGTRIEGTSSGDTTLDPGDRWAAFNDSGGDPVTGFWFGRAALVTQSSDNIEVTYPLNVPAMSTVTIIHYGLFVDDPYGPAVAAQLERVGETTLLEGAQPADIRAAVNDIGVGDYVLTGEAGSVASFSVVDVTGGSAAAQTVAASDGSFRLAVNAMMGQMVTVTASDGTNVTVTLP